MSAPDPAIAGKPVRRLRRSPEDLRAAALAAARRLIIEGPDTALTMRAVAEATGVTYPNLSHHFGSAAGLHAAIAEELVGELLAGLSEVGARMEVFEADPRQVVDQVYDLFQKGGLGRVIGWILRSGEAVRLEPFRAMLSDFIAEQSARAGAPAAQRIAEIMLMVASAAYAESAVGPMFGDLLGLSADARRAGIASALCRMRYDEA